MNFDINLLNDTALVALIRDGDDLAFGELIARHAPAMLRYAYYFTRSQADADEAVQEALITAWQRIEDLRNPRACRSWLMKITARKSLDIVRGRKIHESLEDVDMEATTLKPQEQVDVDETARALKRVLAQMPQTQRHVWLLREIGDNSYEEIAQMLGVSVATVRGRLARARTTIAEEMEEWQ